MVEIKSFRSRQIFFDTLLNLFANIVDIISLNVDPIVILLFCLILFFYSQITLDFINYNAEMLSEFLLESRGR